MRAQPDILITLQHDCLYTRFARTEKIKNVEFAYLFVQGPHGRYEEKYRRIEKSDPENERSYVRHFLDNGPRGLNWNYFGNGTYNAAYLCDSQPLIFKTQLQATTRPKLDAPERSVRLWNEIYDGTPFACAAVCEGGWISPYIESSERLPTEAEICEVMLDIFKKTQRVIVDACAKGNFVKSIIDEKVYCIDIGWAEKFIPTPDLNASSTSLENWSSDMVAKYKTFFADPAIIKKPLTLHFTKALLTIGIFNLNTTHLETFLKDFLNTVNFTNTVIYKLASFFDACSPAMLTVPLKENLSSSLENQLAQLKIFLTSAPLQSESQRLPSFFTPPPPSAAAANAAPAPAICGHSAAASAAHSPASSRAINTPFSAFVTL